MLALRAVLGRPQQSNLLVVTDGPGRGPGELGQLADAQRLLGGGAHDVATCGSPTAGAALCAGRAAATTAPISEIPARHHRAVCMLAMNGISWLLEMWLASPENTLNRTVRGTDEVTTAITNAIEITAPVFWTSTRAAAAMPRRCGATVPIMAAVLGELNIPEPSPTINMNSPLGTLVGCSHRVVIKP